MRILTKSEREAFKKAFAYVQRVSVTEADNIAEIRAGGERLPSVYIDLSQEFGGMVGLQKECSPVNYDKGLQKFIDFCFQYKIQPRKFELKGLIGIERNKMPAVEYTYVSRGGEG
jgi:hypothetical protein